MKLLLLVLMMLLPSVYLLQVFNFHLEAVNVSLSRALLDNVPEEKLPRQFTICSSHLQGRVSINTHTVFVIYQVPGLVENFKLLKYLSWSCYTPDSSEVSSTPSSRGCYQVLYLQIITTLYHNIPI